jgi:hypothetical protein
MQRVVIQLTSCRLLRTHRREEEKRICEKDVDAVRACRVSLTGFLELPLPSLSLGCPGACGQYDSKETSDAIVFEKRFMLAPCKSAHCGSHCDGMQ